MMEHEYDRHLRCRVLLGKYDVGKGELMETRKAYVGCVQGGSQGPKINCVPAAGSIVLYTLLYTLLLVFLLLLLQLPLSIKTL